MLNWAQRFPFLQLIHRGAEFSADIVTLLCVMELVCDFKVQQWSVSILHLRNVSIHPKVMVVSKEILFYWKYRLRWVPFLAKFVCPNSACHKELGAVIILNRNNPGYALQIAALKFLYANEKEAQIVKKWSLYRGTIKPL
jgi:hypothetical protein